MSLARAAATGAALIDRARQLSRDTGCDYLMLKSLDIDPLCEGAGLTRYDARVIAMLSLKPDGIRVRQRLPRPVADAIGPAICRRWLV